MLFWNLSVDTANRQIWVSNIEYTVGKRLYFAAAAGILYTYFNVSDEWMVLDHAWNSECTALPMTCDMTWWVFFYTARTETDNEGFGCYYETLNDCAQYAAACVQAGEESVHFMVPGQHTNEELEPLLQNSGVEGPWKCWYFQRGGYTTFSLYFSR